MKNIQMRRILWGVLSLLLIVAGDQLFAQQIISTFAGTGRSTYNGEGIKALSVNLDGPAAFVSDNQGNTYEADYNGCRIRKIDKDGIVTTIAGNGTPGFTKDGQRAKEATIGKPSGLAIDKDGVLYFSEHDNNCVRKIDRNGILRTIAGDYTSGFSGNGCEAITCQLQSPGALAFDKEGNLYIVDCDNNCVRKVDAHGMINAYAGSGYGAGTGTGGYSGDGGKAASAKLNQPTAIAFDREGNMLVADCFNHCIRKVNKQGIISTVAGNGKPDYSGDGGAAVRSSLSYPVAVATDNKGNIYIADNGNFRIRKIDGAGMISTITGNGTPETTGDCGIAFNATIGKTTFITVGNAGEIYLGDYSENRIRVITETRTDNITNVPVCKPSGNRVTTGTVSASATGSLQ